MQVQIERVYASERLSSSHAPHIFYEFMHARLGSGEAGRDVVLLRLVDSGGQSGPAEIHINDITEVQERLNEFLDRVRKKLDPNATAFRSAAASGASETPTGRFAADALRRRPGANPGQNTPQPMPISMGPRKGTTLEGPIVPRVIVRPGQPEPEPPKERALDETYRILPYSLSDPPNIDQLMRTLDDLADILVVVAKKDLAPKVEDYLKKAGEAGGKAVPTNDFITVVVNREHKRRNPATIAKTRAALASGLQRILGLPKAVLWIPPEV